MISDPHKKIEISIAGKKIPIWTYGEKKNPPIVYIHGLYHPFSAYIGDLPMRHMKNHFFICMDLPGEGRSKDIKMDNLEFIKKVLDQTEPNRKVTLFGYSYGGLLSLMYAAKYPDSVKELVISGTPTMTGWFSFYEISRFVPIFRGRRIDKKIFQEFKFLNKKDLAKIKIPVLLYYNKHDFIANVFMGRKIMNMLPNAQIFYAQHLNHRYGLHRIDATGFQKEMENFIKNEAKNH